MSAKFDKLAAEVGSRRLAGYITQHNPKVRARAEATKARHAAKKAAAKSAAKKAEPTKAAKAATKKAAAPAKRAARKK